jgi:hypothetical protein
LDCALLHSSGTFQELSLDRLSPDLDVVCESLELFGDARLGRVCSEVEVDGAKGTDNLFSDGVGGKGLLLSAAERGGGAAWIKDLKERTGFSIPSREIEENAEVTQGRPLVPLALCSSLWKRVLHTNIGSTCSHIDHF